MGTPGAIALTRLQQGCERYVIESEVVDDELSLVYGFKGGTDVCVSSFGIRKK